MTATPAQWEYLTTPLMIHNTAAILNTWGSQGWAPSAGRSRASFMRAQFREWSFAGSRWAIARRQVPS